MPRIDNQIIVNERWEDIEKKTAELKAEKNRLRKCRLECVQIQDRIIDLDTELQRMLNNYSARMRSIKSEACDAT